VSPKSCRELIGSLPDEDVSGGAVCDALIAAPAAGYGCELVTCDRRAAPVYERYAIRVTML
jgi:predicted nucleic acid-binding protein